MTNERFDYIIIGSGSSGSIIAFRLQEFFPNKKILLIESGSNDNKLTVTIPAGYGYLFYNDKVNWKYKTEKIDGLNGRQDYWPKGKILGGSSSINAMVYIRGQQNDYNNWNIENWSWKDVLPYFLKLENHYLGKSKYHNNDGLINISSIEDEAHILTNKFIQSCVNQGFEKNNDFNGETQEGVGLFQLNTNKGKRSSVSREYLRKIKNKNFKILTKCHVSKILIKDSIAVGIEYYRKSKKFIAEASNEIILSAGSICSPQILQLSGIGDFDYLKNFNVERNVHLPSVGKNLQDHPNVALHYKSKIKSLNDSLRPLHNKIIFFLRWFLNKKGPLTLSINQAGAFIKSDPKISDPDLQIYFLPLTATSSGKVGNLSVSPDPFSGLTIAPSLCRPQSRGFVNINSANPMDYPSINPNYYDCDEDLNLMLKAYKISNKISETKPLSDFIDTKIGPHKNVDKDDEIKEFIKNFSKTTYHPVGTCSMGISEKTSVVDSNLKLHGIKNLRVADASIMPKIISGNTNSACMMIGEKCADLIKESL